ncbi:MAG: LysR family transcriptional regulator, partial [Paracoccaceae bacterium]
MNTRVLAITLKQLRALSSVAETGSLTATATTFGLTAPAIHNQLKLLEENLGCPLVLRGGGVPARLTAEGRILTGSFAAMERTLEGALRQIHARRSGLAGSVVLGVVSTAKYFAPALVARIQTAYRDIEMVLKVGNRDEIIAMLGHGLVDLVIMGRPPREPQVEARVIGVHPLVIIAPPGHRFAAAEDLTPEELLQETFIAREPGSGTRILMIRYLDRIGEGLPYRFIEMGSNETIKQAVI